MKLAREVEIDPEFHAEFVSEHRPLTLAIGEEIYLLVDQGLRPAYICKKLGITISSYNLAMKRRPLLVDDSEELYP